MRTTLSLDDDVAAKLRDLAHRRKRPSGTHLAALAIEHQCELHSNDTDFARFPGLRRRNPLA